MKCSPSAPAGCAFDMAGRTTAKHRLSREAAWRHPKKKIDFIALKQRCRRPGLLDDSRGYRKRSAALHSQAEGSTFSVLWTSACQACATWQGSPGSRRKRPVRRGRTVGQGCEKTAVPVHTPCGSILWLGRVSTRHCMSGRYGKAHRRTQTDEWA